MYVLASPYELAHAGQTPGSVEVPRYGVCPNIVAWAAPRRNKVAALAGGPCETAGGALLQTIPADHRMAESRDAVGQPISSGGRLCRGVLPLRSPRQKAGNRSDAFKNKVGDLVRTSDECGAHASRASALLVCAAERPVLGPMHMLERAAFGLFVGICIALCEDGVLQGSSCWTLALTLCTCSVCGHLVWMAEYTTYIGVQMSPWAPV